MRLQNKYRTVMVAALSAAWFISSTSAHALFKDPPVTMLIVSHQDDDINLMNPDIVSTMRQPSASFYSVVLTSGDAGFICREPNPVTGACNDNYIKGRETGHLAAYAQLAGIAVDPLHPDQAWTSQWLPLSNGKFVRMRTLNNRIHVIYIGLANDDTLALETLWNASSTAVTIKTLECDTRRPAVSTYTRPELIETLRILMATYQPTHISTLDSSKLWDLTYPFEHTDHVHGALFALTASQKYSTAHTLRSYRSYNTLFELENVATDDAAFKLAAFQTYGTWDDWFPNAHNNNCPLGVVTMCGRTEICQDPVLFWGGLEDRQYSIAPVQGKGISGGIQGPSGCMNASSATSGSAVTLASCNLAAAGQEWVLGSDGTIRPKSGTTLCVTAAGANTAFRPRGIGLTLSVCAAATTPQAFNQQFALMSNGQLRGPDATCLAANSGALTIAECSTATNQQGFRPQFYPIPSTTATTGYTLTEIPDRFDIYHTLSYADLDGGTQKFADVCVRRTGGVYCSKSTGTAFGTATRFTSEFADGSVWTGAGYGSTVQLADVNNDKKADVCGRNGDGIRCALGNGTSFAASTAWSSGLDFSDWVGYGLAGSSYNSLHFPDVNADGFADVCARNATGIECALNKGGTLKAFYGVTQWLNTEFRNDLGWNDEAHGSTVQFADVDGDGYSDVCGRGGDGIICALNDTQGHFVKQHRWSAGDDFSDSAGWGNTRSRYGSIHLGDLNGDGRADICGRSSAGLYCGISLGASFAEVKAMIPLYPFDDATNWNPDRYGSTLTLADIDGDGHADVCGRGPIAATSSIGLRCAFSP
jgi:hypothetical protein